MSLFEEKIKKELDDSKIKNNDRYLFKGRLIFGISLLVGIIICLLYFYFLNFIPVIIGVIIIFIGLISSLYFFVQANKISRVNQQFLMQLAPSLYKIYFENNKDLYPTNWNLQFKGIFPSQIFKNNSLHFSWGIESIIWDIDEDIEQRTITVSLSKGGTTTKTYFVYVIKYCLISTAQKLNNLSDIYVSEGRSPKKDESFFKSESMEFNNRFKVQNWNQMDVYKLFTPKIIDNFLNTEVNFLDSKKIQLKNGKAEISWRGPESLKSWVPNVLDFSKIRWSKEKMINDILNKLNLDFTRYLKLQRMLDPLEFYN